MPGLLGVLGDPASGAVASRFATVLGAMRRGPRHLIESHPDPTGRWALGRVHLGALQRADQLNSAGPPHVVFHGDLHNEAALRQMRAAGGNAPASTAALIGELYRTTGPGVAAQLKGSFCAAIIDDAQQRLVLISDRLGSYPIYWFHAPGRFTFASELHAALRDHPKPQLDLETVHNLAVLGFPFGEKTLAAGVRLVPPGTVLTYKWDNDEVVLERYAALADSFREQETPRDTYFEQVSEAFRGAMDRAVMGAARFGLSLSGGLDTRVILSALDRLRVPVSTFTIGGKGCADEVIADRLARMSASEHRFIELGDRYLGDLVPNMRRMVSLTDGMYVSHGFTETLALQAFEQSDFSVLLRGHAGELAKTSTAWPLHTDARINDMRSVDEFIPYMQARLESHYHGASMRELVRGDGADIFANGHARHTLEQAVADAPLTPTDLCSYLYLHEYHRRVTIPSLEVFRHVVDVRLPLADMDFLGVVLEGRRSWREGTDIHRALIAANSRRFLGVRNPNTGARAAAGPREEWVFDKLNSILRRLNVYGYRHYHSFDGWMRQAFLESVERVLLGADVVSSYLEPAALRRIVEEAKQGARNHDHVLQVLTTVELWQRENL